MIATGSGTQSVDRLRCDLDSLAARFDPEWMSADPVRYAHRSSRPADQEVVAFLSATFAFGTVKGIFRTLDLLVGRLGDAPAGLLRRLSMREAMTLARGFRHRWVGPSDLARLLVATGRILDEHGSLESAFGAGDERASRTIEPGLRGFSRRLL